MTHEQLQTIRAYYTHYRQQLEPLRERIKENNAWYCGEQTEFGSGKKDPSAPRSRTGHLFNAIQYKHADLMDNYPHINILPREESDAELAQTLTGIMPYILENSDFKRTYSINGYEKLKHGTAVYGVSYDAEKEDIVIDKVDLLTLSFQPGIEDIQDSKFVFVDSFMDIEEFKDIYGEQQGIKTQTTYDENEAGPERDFLSETVVITDCYYKVSRGGRKILHFVKFSGDAVLDYTEGKDEYKDGLYKHGRYPFVFDVLHPDPGELCGRGIIDIGKETQAYIDKLDDIINTNALLSGIPRYFIRDGAGINVDDFTDISKKVVTVTGSLNDEVVKEIKASTLPSFISNHRGTKIEELKEVLGNRDFSQGGTTGGVTAASAITALQNSGDKLSRDMINTSYYAFSDVIWLVVELVREFYDEEKTFRILGDDGSFTYKAFSNEGMKEHPVAGGIERFFSVKDVPEVAEMLDVPVVYEKPLFDITLTVEKNNPYQRAQHNELILALYNMGLFNPQNAEVGRFVISNLNFDGKEKILQQLDEQAQRAEMAQSVTNGADMSQVVTADAAPVSSSEGGSGEAMLSFPIEEGTLADDEMMAFPIG